MRIPLLNLFHRSDPTDIKASRTGALIALMTGGRARWTPRDYGALAREGYQQNPVAYRCVRLIAESVAGLPLVLMDGARELDTHPLLDLLQQPNPRQTGAALLGGATGHLLVAGNAYLEAAAVGDRIGGEGRAGCPAASGVARPAKSVRAAKAGSV